MDKKIAALLEDIKKLMILDLAERGVQGKRIADALDIDPAIVSRIVSKRKNKKG